MGWLREGSAEQKVFAGGRKDGQPAGICFRSLARLAMTEEEIKSIRVPVIILFGDVWTITFQGNCGNSARVDRK